MKTRAAVFKPSWEIELREVELPQPPPGYALVKVDACCVCGSDVLWMDTGLPGMKDWFPFGHELAGVVAEVNSTESDLKPGDTVVFQSSIFCGLCDKCRDGRVDLCRSAQGTWDSRAMGFSDYMLAPARSLVKYEGLSPEVAALAEPGAVGFDLVKTAEIELGESVCLIGPGPIGLMALPLALRRGPTELVCIGRPGSERRLALAEELGADVVVHDAPFEELKDFQKHFDHVLMTAPTQMIPSALSLLRYGGRLSYIGLSHGDNNITFNAEDFHFRKLQLRASMASPALYFPSVLKFLKNAVIPGEKMLSHRFKLDQIKDAVGVYRTEKNKTVKTVVTPN